MQKPTFEERPEVIRHPEISLLGLKNPGIRALVQYPPPPPLMSQTVDVKAAALGSTAHCCLGTLMFTDAYLTLQSPGRKAHTEWANNMNDLMDDISNEKGRNHHVFMRGKTEIKEERSYKIFLPFEIIIHRPF